MANRVMKKPDMVVEILGGARIRVAGGTIIRLTNPRVAILVTYLALEGPTARERVAELLYPSRQRRSQGGNGHDPRRNLRGLIHTLNKTLSAAGLPPCVKDAGQMLRIREGVPTDATLLLKQFAARDYAAAVKLGGELLAGVSLKDCGEEVVEWLQRARQRLLNIQIEALKLWAQALEHEGRLPEALHFAIQRIELEPLSDEAHLHLMRLHWHRGDRDSALRVYAQYKGRLRAHEMNPAPDVERLVKEILAWKAPSRPSGSRIAPASVHRPPVLIGREKEWEALEKAWQAQKVIYVCGVPGVGKSRLASDFARTKGRSAHLEAMPGDVQVPFSTHSRSLRALLDARPDLSIPPELIHHVSRVVPGLSEERLPMAVGNDEKLALFDALCQAFYQYLEDLSVLVVDDAHFFDELSFEFGMYFQRFALPLVRKGQCPNGITVFRAEDLDPRYLAIVRQQVDAGLAVLIDVQPLNPDEMRNLLEAMRVSGLDDFIEEIVRLSGGNPFLAIEAVRDLIESGEAHTGRGGSSRRYEVLVERRLRRLQHPYSRRVAQVIAVAQSEVSLETAACVLDVPPSELIDAWSELESARIIGANCWFTHDLLAQGVLKQTPDAVKEFFRHKLAECRTRCGHS